MVALIVTQAVLTTVTEHSLAIAMDITIMLMVAGVHIA